MFPMAAIEREGSLRDKALRVLRQGIVSGEIQSGELYSATALARRLKVSVSPVREAMLTLVNAGIMEAVRNRGFRVVELSQDDLNEIFEIRVLLEVPAVCALTKCDLAADSEYLDELVRATETSAASEDVNTFLAADREFHLALIRLHGNERLVATVADLRDQTRLYGLRETAEHSLAEAAQEHRAMLEALLAGDSALTHTLVTAHLGHVRKEWASPSRDSPRPQPN